MIAQVRPFFDKTTGTYTYVVYDGVSRRAAIIDPVLDYDHRSGRTHTTSCDAVIAFVGQESLTVDWILETHAHADHLSGAVLLKGKMAGKIGIGANISTVQATFKRIFNLESALAVDGSQFDRLFADGEEFQVGELAARTYAVPGHTPACVAYHIDDSLFVGDTLFMPDCGSARCDFPGGDARTLYRSIRRLLSQPEETRLFVCHDYPPAGRDAQCETTVGAQRAANIHVHDGISEEAFVTMRSTRDKTLDMPLLIIPAIQVNIRAGAWPAAEENGTVYLKIPIDAW
ncbi:MAG: MBL fold metallo-hydrolase [Gammaproteobacteria bacterium]|nr:MBL fold metallo-hydrolase [Gammaproteobacteria bacterium]